MENKKILIIEDDRDILEQLTGALEDEDYAPVGTTTGEDAMEKLACESFALVITDLRLPGAGGLDILEKARELQPDCPVLLITAHASVDTAVKAMRMGAFHYLEKPLSLDTLLAEVEKAIEHGSILRERDALKQKLAMEHGVAKILGESRKIQELRTMVLEVANANSTVLITGETGTGKELVANALHFESARAGKPFVKVNCAALTETLLESELFGHEKGAFTGAESSRSGKFERADGGSLLLDEITEMGAHVQAKLLRALQGSTFERVGGDEPVKVDVRVISATNRDPEKAVEEGRLRKDLFYRLNIIKIDVPTLRERPTDISFLASSFLKKFAAKHGKEIEGFTDKAMDALNSYDWPGNIRELENCVERASILARGDVIEKDDLPPTLSDISETVSEIQTSFDLREIEKQAVLRALEETGWNKTKASELLGIYPSSLYKKMKRFGIPQKQKS